MHYFSRSLITNRTMPQKQSKKHRARIRNRERRRRARHERAARPRADRIADPIEIVLRVLMACRLPEELARMILFGYRVLRTPSARALTGAGELRVAMRMFDTWDGEPDYHTCTCTWEDDYDTFALRNEAARFAARWRTGCYKNREGTSFITCQAACHTLTYHPWRGDRPAADFIAIQENYGENAQLWVTCLGSCGRTRLHYRLWLVARGHDLTRSPPIKPREYSLARWLKRAPMYQLADAIELNVGQYSCGHTRQERVRILLGELEWHDRDWWHWNQHKTAFAVPPLTRKDLESLQRRN